MLRISIVLFIALSSFFLQAYKSPEKTIITSSQSVENDTLKDSPYKRKSIKEISAVQLETDGIFIDALKEVELGNINPAIALFEQVIGLDSTYSAAYYELANLYFIKSKPQQAIQANLKAIEIEPENQWYMIQLAGIYQQLAQHKKACDIYKTLVERYPEQEEYYEEWAKALLMARQGKESIEVFNKWEKRVGINEETSMKKQQIWLALGNAKKATKEIQNLAKAFPEEKKYNAILAELYMQQKKYKKAQKVYLQIKKIDPYDKYIDISLAELYKKTKKAEKAYESLKLGFQNPFLEEDTKIQVLAAFYTVDEFYKIYPEYTFDLTKTLVSIYPGNTIILPIYGDFLYRKEKYNEALPILRKSIQLDSSRYEVWEILLLCEMQLDDGRLLKQDITTVFDLFPAQPFPYYIYANYLATKKHYSEALEYYQRGVRWVLGNNELLGIFYSGMAECYHQQKNYAKSDEFLQKVLALNPDNYPVLNNYAFYLAERNENLDEAEKMSKKTISKEPKNQTYLDTYAWVLYRKKRFKEALSYIEKACEPEKTSSGLIWEHKGDILFQLNEKTKAKEAWLKAEKMGGGSAELTNKISNVK